MNRLLLLFVMALALSTSAAAVSVCSVTRGKTPCCGNKSCEWNETFLNCDLDCKPKSVSVTVDFNSEKSFLHNDDVVIRASATADGLIALEAKAEAKGFFGTITLFDDGVHADDDKNDGIYANYFTVANDIKKGSYSVTVTVTKAGTSGTKSFPILVEPSLVFSVLPLKDSFALGESIDLNGKISVRQKPLKGAPVKVSILANSKTLQSATISSDENGFFSFSYHTSLIDPIGDWEISASASDENNNIGSFKKKLAVSRFEGGSYYKVDILEPSLKAFGRGEKIKALISVSDGRKQIENATAKIVLPNKQEVELKEVSPGFYSDTFMLPPDANVGRQKIEAKVQSMEGNVMFAGFATVEILVEKGRIEAKRLSPAKDIFFPADTISFIFELSYQNGGPVLDANAIVFVNGKRRRMAEKKEGTYATSIAAADYGLGLLDINVFASDSFENSFSDSFFIKIEEEPVPFSFLLNDPLAISIIGIICFFIVFFVVLQRYDWVRQLILERRKEEIVKMREELQKKYFSSEIFDTVEYNELMSEYENELREIESSLEIIKKKKMQEDGREGKAGKGGAETTVIGDSAEGQARTSENSPIGGNAGSKAGGTSA